MASTSAKLSFCVLGIYSAFITWGYLQERVTTTQYKSVTTGESHKFQHSLFLNFAQCLVCSLIAGITVLVLKPAANKAPMHEYLKAALSNTLGSPCAYNSLRYINFPTMVLAKSCKLIPVMAVGVIWFQKKYPRLEYLCVVLVTAGIVMFTYFKDSNKTDTRTNEWHGLLLVAANLVLDGYTNAQQDNLLREYKMSSYHMMLFMNLWGSVLLLLWLIAGNFWDGDGGLHDAYVFCMEHPDILPDMALFSFCGAMGQMFIFYTVKEFGALTNTTITITRKFWTIMLSVLLFGHSLNEKQWIGVFVMFSGLSLNVYGKYTKVTGKDKTS